MPADRLAILLKSMATDSNINLRSWRLECSLITLAHPELYPCEIVRYQRDHDDLLANVVQPEHYEYRDGFSAVSFRVVDRLSGQESVEGALSIFSSLPSDRLTKIPLAYHEHHAAMLSYDIVDALIPIMTNSSLLGSKEAHR